MNTDEFQTPAAILAEPGIVGFAFPWRCDPVLTAVLTEISQ